MTEQTKEEMLEELNASRKAFKNIRDEAFTKLEESALKISNMEKTFNVTIGVLREQRETAHDLLAQQKVITINIETVLKDQIAEMSRQLDHMTEECSVLEKENIFLKEILKKSNIDY